MPCGPALTQAANRPLVQDAGSRCSCTPLPGMRQRAGSHPGALAYLPGAPRMLGLCWVLGGRYDPGTPELPAMWHLPQGAGRGGHRRRWWNPPEMKSRALRPARSMVRAAMSTDKSLTAPTMAASSSGGCREGAPGLRDPGLLLPSLLPLPQRHAGCPGPRPWPQPLGGTELPLSTGTFPGHRGPEPRPDGTGGTAVTNLQRSSPSEPRACYLHSAGKEAEVWGGRGSPQREAGALN